MLDPLTAYTAKIATTTTLGGLLTGMSTVQAQESAGFDTSSIITAGTGLGLLAAGVWKLLGDHTAVERERETQALRIKSMQAELDVAEEQAARWRQHAHDIELAAARLGIDLPELPRHRSGDGSDLP